MDIAGWGIVAVLVVGTAVVAYGWLSDRRATREQLAALQTPPDDGPAPAYVSPADPTSSVARTLTDAERDRLPERLADLPNLASGRLGEDFATDPPWTVLRHPAVLVCSDELSQERDLIPVLTRLGPHRPPLVIVAPAIERTVLATLAINFTHQVLLALPVQADEATRARVCELTGANPVPQADLHAGYLDADALGTCETWVADARHSWIDQGEPSS